MEWLLANWLELFGTLSALIYLYFSIKQNVWLWPLGFIASAVYTVVYLKSGFYADMVLQVYYLVISVYGWYHWVFRGDQNKSRELPVTKLDKKLGLLLLLISLLLFVLIAFVLNYFTNSDVPIGDALTTAFSVTATWMLARKIIEHWLIWIVVDALSMGLYVYKGLYLTAGLFMVYTIMAVVGYYQWRKTISD